MLLISFIMKYLANILGFGLVSKSLLLYINIGNKIKDLRRKLGLQAKKLAEQIGISPSYLNLIESGKRKIDGDLLLKISQELRIELSDISSEIGLNLDNSKIAIANFSNKTIK